MKKHKFLVNRFLRCRGCTYPAAPEGQPREHEASRLTPFAASRLPRKRPIIFSGHLLGARTASLNHFDDLVCYWINKVRYWINKKYQIIDDSITMFRWDFEFWQFIKLYSYGRQYRTRRKCASHRYG